MNKDDEIKAYYAQVEVEKGHYAFHQERADRIFDILLSYQENPSREIEYLRMKSQNEKK